MERHRSAARRVNSLAPGCRLCRSRTPRADCPRCGAKQLQLFDPSPILPIPDDAETTTIDEIAAAARRARQLEAERIERLTALGRPVRVGLIGCANTKRAEPSPARALYRSPLFVAALAHAERACDETYVISAAHGLLPLDETVQPYDRVLRELPKKERLAWGSRVTESVRARFPLLPLHIGGAFSRGAERLLEGRRYRVDDREAVFLALLSRARLPRKRLDALEAGYQREPEASAFGIVQAVTRASQEFPPEARYDLERAAAGYLAGLRQDD